TFSVTDGIARLRTGDEESFETAVLRPVPQVPRKALSDAMTIEARGRVFLHATLDTEYIEARRWNLALPDGAKGETHNNHFFSTRTWSHPVQRNSILLIPEVELTRISFWY